MGPNVVARWVARGFPPARYGWVSIYGIFTDDLICHYVGRTVNPHSRRRAYRKRDNRIRRALGLNWQMRVFFQCPAAEADRNERIALKLFRTLGQAKLNRERTPSDVNSLQVNAKLIFW